MRLSLNLLLFLFLVQCSEDSIPEIAEQEELPEYIFILDEIPDHIQEVENLTIYPGNSEPLYEIELIPEQTYGKTREYYITKLEWLTVDDKRRVIVADRGSNYASALHVFNEDGTYRTPLGRPGWGPGEYMEPFFLQENAGRVYLYDVTGKRIIAYNADDYSVIKTSLEESWDIRNQKDMQGFQFGGFKVRNDGKILAEFYKPNRNIGSSRGESTYLLMDLDGNRLDFEPFTIYGYLQILTENNYPFASLFPIGRTLTAMSNEGELFVANTQEFLIKKYNSKGVYQTAFYYPIEGSPFDIEEFLKSGRKFGRVIPKIDELKKAFNDIGEELPKTSPVVDELMVDDENRIWVAVPAGAKNNIYNWWILDESGKLLAKLQRPREKTIFDIKNGYLYTKEIDAETDAEYVVKHRIEFKERNSLYTDE